MEPDSSARAARAHLNAAGTSWPKPEPVRRAVAELDALHPAEWGERFERDHHALAELVGADPTRVLPTPGCTSALSLALADLPWAPGDRLLISSLEHHALMRPAELLGRRGVELVSIPMAGSDPLDLDRLEVELRRGARCVALSHASNVTGALFPVAEVIELAHRHGAVVLVDAAQTAGWMPLPERADLVAFSGHKGPQAPLGIGVLRVAPGVAMRTPSAVCTLDAGPSCAPMPGYCDAGSVSRGPLAGLAAGLRWMAERPDALEHARGQVGLLEEVARAAGARIHGPALARRMPTLALTSDRDPGAMARALAAEGVVASGGLQCAPAAHEALGTAPGGVLRLSVGPTLPDAALGHAASALERVLSSAV